MADLTCSNCSGVLKFNPGEQSLKCPYCGTVNEIPGAEPAEVIEELDFESALTQFEEMENSSDAESVIMCNCGGCGAEVSVSANETTANCDFCGTHLVISGKGKKVMKPQYLLPFKITRDKAKALFKEWLGKRRFAPSSLKRKALMKDGLNGIYYPYWTFDSSTQTEYRGERGDDYEEEEEYTDEEGDTQTRTVTKTDWTSVSGTVSRVFDDVLVPASRSIKKKLTQLLDKWNKSEMVNYDKQYLSGFKAESYSVGIKEGFEEAKAQMLEQIKSDIRGDIGGDHQRIHSMNPAFSNITFKYLLFPIWIVVYNFHGKYYTVLVNANTGEIEGERPFSALKIFLLILAIAAGIGGLIAIAKILGLF